MPDTYGKKSVLMSVLLLVAAGLLTACNDESNSDVRTQPVPIEQPVSIEKPAAFNFITLEPSIDTDGTFVFTWEESKRAETYQVCRQKFFQENMCDPIGKPVTGTTLKLASSEIKAVQGSTYFIRASNVAGYKDSSTQSMALTDFVSSISYLKANNVNTKAYFGGATSLSTNGNTLAVSAIGNGVYIFNRDNNGNWSEPLFLKNPGSQNNRFGKSISLSGDGKTLAVGAHMNEVIERQENNPNGSITLWGEFSGTVFVYSLDNKGLWGEPVALNKGGNLSYRDLFGHSVSLNYDGTRLAVGAIWESQNSAPNSGSVYVFDRDAQTGWGTPVQLKASKINANDEFGFSLSLSKNGHTLAVGAPSNYRGGETSGSVYVFNWNENGTWETPAHIQARKSNKADLFGMALSLSGDGNTLSVSPVYQVTEYDENGTTVYVYHRDANKKWDIQNPTLLKSSVANGSFGSSVSLNDDGTVLAIGDGFDDSTLITEPSYDHRQTDSGAVYVFNRDAKGVYGAPRYLKATNMDEDDRFGDVVSLSGDGKTLAIGAPREDSGSDDQGNNSVEDSGAVYVYQ